MEGGGKKQGRLIREEIKNKRNKNTDEIQGGGEWIYKEKT